MKKTPTQELSDISQFYAGAMSATASSRRFLDFEPNITVRDDFQASDYYKFRPNESIDGTYKSVMKKSAKAYENVGLIKTIIDLMGDFTSQGATISHSNKAIERFYKRWWAKINGDERTERFSNIFYRLGNVPIYKYFGKITRKEQRNMSKAASRMIPLRYEFLNPINLELNSDAADIFSGEKKYSLKVTPKLKEAINKKAPVDLDNKFKRLIKDGATSIPLDPERFSIFFYKKDDWALWANPMIHAILDDVTMLEKFKLADMAALDGAISNIRLWNLGSLDHKILPTKDSINRLRDILATNVGGGTMDLVWGPELSFKESNTQVYHFLGNEKYGPVLSAIYGGIGIPQSLTGSSSAQGFTNNYLSLKTLIEKLEYGRSILLDFWNNEFQIVAREMGFDSPAELKFDHMILSDEAAEKNLWIQLCDRNIISIETLRERFGHNSEIEESRITTEEKKRKKRKIPAKSDPFHTGNAESEYVKIALQKGTVGINDVTDYKEREVPSSEDKGVTPEKVTPNSNGRPLNKKDSNVRKQRRVLPKSKTPTLAEMILWASDAQKKIASILNPVIIASYNKSNLRELTTAQEQELENIKFIALCGMEPFCEITDEKVANSLESGKKMSITSLYRNFIEKNGREPSIDEKRQIQCLVFCIENFEKNNNP